MLALLLICARLPHDMPHAQHTRAIRARRNDAVQFDPIVWPAVQQAPFRLGVELTLTMAGELAQLGLFATEDIPKHTFVTWYGGLLRDAADVRKAGEASHARSLMDNNLVLDGTPLAKRFVRDRLTKEQLAALAATPTAVSLPDDAEVRASPLGYMANTSGSAHAINVEVGRTTPTGLLPKSFRNTAQSSAVVEALRQAAQRGLRLLFLYTTKDVLAGDQLLSAYHNAASGEHGAVLYDLA